jgi:hypothetical protein
MDAAEMLAVPVHVQQHTVLFLLLLQPNLDTANSHNGCLVQSAVGAGSAQQAALVIDTALHDR